MLPVLAVQSARAERRMALAAESHQGLIMCLLSVEVGFLKPKGEPYNERDLDVKMSAALLRGNGSERNEELRSRIWEIGHSLKAIEPEKRVIIRDNYWCSGTELSGFYEVNAVVADDQGRRTGTVTKLYADEAEA